MLKLPFQTTNVLVRDMCMRNWTKHAMDGREETKGLGEIDKTATDKINKDLDKQERNTLDITRTGATWSHMDKDRGCLGRTNGQQYLRVVQSRRREG